MHGWGFQIERRAGRDSALCSGSKSLRPRRPWRITRRQLFYALGAAASSFLVGCERGGGEAVRKRKLRLESFNRDEGRILGVLAGLVLPTLDSSGFDPVTFMGLARI